MCRGRVLDTHSGPSTVLDAWTAGASPAPGRVSGGLPSRASHLYWVTAGLALAEQWNVTTLSSNTGCGSTDRLTSGGSVERRGALADCGAVCT